VVFRFVFVGDVGGEVEVADVPFGACALRRRDAYFVNKSLSVGVDECSTPPSETSDDLSLVD
jgi:hypothetical protein